ncbi:hypothetical protein KVR01_013155 [Diaporthe batatas]|uniref:uncharacterized protein n=1 Tax=Diaporthe batatas TaxID=748121 RepID=UPI001D03BCB7|nr:uncharacterized protein KVR01_013155 [Diaporthe batatas]KAG8156933.1 hypothetical protein KVR01_013155 [Diaporthe batatas]
MSFTLNSDTMSPWLLIVGAILLVSIRYSWNKFFDRRTLPPGPKGVPLIGNLHQVPKQRQFDQYYQWSKEYGPIMYFNMAGRPLVVLSSHKAAHGLLSLRSSRYSDRPRMVMASDLITKGMHILMRPYDAAYRLHQRMQAPDLESRQMLFDILKESDAAGGKGIYASHHMERSMASFIYSLSYGYRLRTGHEEHFEDAKRVQVQFKETGLVGGYIVDVLPVLNNLPSFLAPWKKKAEEIYQLEKRLHTGNVRRGLENPGWNFTKHYFNHSPEAKGMSDVEIAYDLGVIADAALDTSTVTLAWLLVAWATSDGEWVAKAQRLLDNVVGRDRMPRFEDRDKLAYIDAIANETLRWRPVLVGGVPHFTKTEDTYMGYKIPAGSIVIGTHFAITQQESSFGDRPADFIPERWLAEDGGLKDLPLTGFGFGRRICTGKHIARNNLYIHMAKLLWAFDIELGISEVTGEQERIDDMAGTEGLVFSPAPFKAVFRPRGPWIRELIERQGNTHEVDHAEILAEIGRGMIPKSGA